MASVTSPAPGLGNRKYAEQFLDPRYDASTTYIWMLLTVQASDNVGISPVRDVETQQTTGQKILNALNSVKGWKSLFPEPSKAPSASEWTSRRVAPGGDGVYWFTYKIPVPLTAFETSDYLKSKIQNGAEKGGILGLNAQEPKLYWELYPIERFKVVIKDGKGTVKGLRDELRSKGVVAEVPTDAENTSLGSEFPIYSVVNLVRYWAAKTEGNTYAERSGNRTWGEIRADTGQVTHESVEAILDRGQETKSDPMIQDLKDARARILVVNGDMGTQPIKKNKWVIIGIILGAVGGGFILAFVLYYFFFRPKPVQGGQGGQMSQMGGNGYQF